MIDVDALDLLEGLATVIRILLGRVRVDVDVMVGLEGLWEIRIVVAAGELRHKRRRRLHHLIPAREGKEGVCLNLFDPRRSQAQRRVHLEQAANERRGHGRERLRVDRRVHDRVEHQLGRLARKWRLAHSQLV